MRLISIYPPSRFEEETVEHIKKAVELEIAYAHDVLPRGILGLNADMFVDYMQYIGNRRLEGIGIDFRFNSDHNPFPWLSEVVDIGAMTNFFERKVKDYQNSGVLEDDF
jgi:ribonucleoside-diphosphate reductase beta chain